jgi:ParB-like chromosome segregation protein Spo0J
MIMKVRPDQCVPMTEMKRDFYDQSNYFYLRRTISQDGFNDAYPLRAIYNSTTGKYEVFDGIHRLQVAQDLGLDSIPLKVESVSRSVALGEGYKANRTHAHYNTMDKAKHFESMQNEVVSRQRCLENRWRTLGRPPSPLHEVAKLTGEDLKTVQRHLDLLKLPYQIQEHIGNGRLSYTVALQIVRLITSNKEHLVSSIAEQAITQHWTSREAQQRIDQILSNENRIEQKACQACGRGFPREEIRKLDLCPECTEKIKTTQASFRTSTRSPYLESKYGYTEDNHAQTNSRTPFMDMIRSEQEINGVRQQMGLPPIRRHRQ